MKLLTLLTLHALSFKDNTDADTVVFSSIAYSLVHFSVIHNFKLSIYWCSGFGREPVMESLLCEYYAARTAKIIWCYFTVCHIWERWELFGRDQLHSLCVAKSNKHNYAFLLFSGWKAHWCNWMGCVCSFKQNALPVTTNHTQLVSYLL